MHIQELAHRLRLECVTKEQEESLLQELGDRDKTSVVARSMLSALRSDLLETRGIDEFLPIQTRIHDLEYLLWKLGKD